MRGRSEAEPRSDPSYAGAARLCSGGAGLLLLRLLLGLGLLGPGTVAARLGRRVLLALAPLDPVGFALLERVTLLVEVGTEVIDHPLDRLTKGCLVLAGEVAALVDPVEQGLVRGG